MVKSLSFRPLPPVDDLIPKVRLSLIMPSTTSIKSRQFFNRKHANRRPDLQISQIFIRISWRFCKRINVNNDPFRKCTLKSLDFSKPLLIFWMTLNNFYLTTVQRKLALQAREGVCLLLVVLHPLHRRCLRKRNVRRTVWSLSQPDPDLLAQRYIVLCSFLTLAL